MEEAYTNKEINSLSTDCWPERGPRCEKCGSHIPVFADLAPDKAAEIRELEKTDSIAAFRAIRGASGCNLAWAKIWLLHPDGPQPKRTESETPCPYCGKCLRTDKAKQCFHCGMDWHDSHHTEMPFMSRPYSEKLWIVRKRVLWFLAVFFTAGGVGAILAWHVSDATEDPGPVVYLFAVVVAIILGTLPTLAYFLNKWITRFDVTSCPACGECIWPTTIQAIQISIIPRCPRCWKRLADPVSDNKHGGE